MNLVKLKALNSLSPPPSAFTSFRQMVDVERVSAILSLRAVI
jgi:hypothetical protein